MSKLKIFITYKDKHKLLKNDILQPIQTGRAIANEAFAGMLGDSTGDNISEKNPRYCELTAQYWVWKNYEKIGNPDYVGFMHYRRQFIFDETLRHTRYLWLPNSEFYIVNKIYNNYENHFTQEKIFPYLENSDCIAFKRVDISKISYQTNMKQHFIKSMQQKEEAFDAMEDALKSNYPDYIDTFEKFKNGTTMFCCNSFVMPKELFFEYSEFLFNILSKVDENVDYSEFNSTEMRFLGFLGEYLLSIFIFHKLEDTNFKLTELAGTLVAKIGNKYKFKFIKYNILRRICWGKKRKYYTKKYIKFKHVLGK